MNDQLEMLPGTNRDTSKSQYFTPPKLAQRMVEWAGVTRKCGHNCAHPCGVDCRPMRVLEPSAGNGALVRPLVAAGAEVHAIEIDARYHTDLKSIRFSGLLYCPKDFLAIDDWPWTYDLCVMNPPYHDEGEMLFISHALRFAPRVVGIFRADVFYSVSRGEKLWSMVRPTRAAFCSRRPWKGAETDYCVLDLVKLHAPTDEPGHCELEWWADRWF